VDERTEEVRMTLPFDAVAHHLAFDAPGVNICPD
jgi:hypothetical protein